MTTSQPQPLDEKVETFFGWREKPKTIPASLPFLEEKEDAPKSEQVSSSAVLGRSSGWWCVECKTLCHTYEEELCCACAPPWETEALSKDDYPEKWIRCEVVVLGV